MLKILKCRNVENVEMCVVEWLHRREIASAGPVAHTNALVQSAISQPSDHILVIIMNENHKSILIMQLQYVRRLFSESITVGR